MEVSAVKFNTKDRPEFYKELRKRVNSYFKENNLSKHADLNMKLKTAFMLLLYFVPWALMVIGVVSSSWLVTYVDFDELWNVWHWFIDHARCQSRFIF